MTGYLYEGDEKLDTCTLYKKNTPVATFECINMNGFHIDKMHVLINPELLPLHMRTNYTDEKMRQWVEKRNIPETRERLRETRLNFGAGWQNNLAMASLSDQYWFQHGRESWDKINFFTNVYSEDIGNIFFEPWTMKRGKLNNFSPDLTTNGALCKRWKQREDKTSFLIKAGSKKYCQEPLNEVLAANTLNHLKLVPALRYNLIIEGVDLCSVCDNFITERTEFVPASQVYDAIPKRDEDSCYTHLLRGFEKFDIPGAKEFLDNMIVCDNIIGNEDRHLGNFGFILDVETNKFIGPAPLFDSGTAFWSAKKMMQNKTKSKLFGDVEQKLIRHSIKHTSFISLKNLNCNELIDSYPWISDEKKISILKAVRKKAHYYNMEINNQTFER